MNGNAPGSKLEMTLKQNTARWDMAWHDIGFLLKVLHDVEAVKDESQFFAFEANYTPDLSEMTYQKVVGGTWMAPIGETSSQ